MRIHRHPRAVSCAVILPTVKGRHVDYCHCAAAATPSCRRSLPLYLALPSLSRWQRSAAKAWLLFAWPSRELCGFIGSQFYFIYTLELVALLSCSPPSPFGCCSLCCFFCSLYCVRPARDAHRFVSYLDAINTLQLEFDVE